MKVTIDLSKEELKDIKAHIEMQEAVGYISKGFPIETIYLKVCNEVKEESKCQKKQ